MPDVSSPGCLTAIPSAIVKPEPPGSVPAAWTPTMRRPGRTARSASAMPAASPPPPIGITTVSAFSHLLGELEPDRPLPGDHERVLERVDERRAALVDVRPAPRRARPRAPGR